MTVHDLKIWPQYFQPVVERVKTFEVRENDRGFKVGDILNLREWDQTIGEEGNYTGRSIEARVLYILNGSMTNQIMAGYVVMSIEVI